MVAIITQHFLQRVGDACIKLARYERWEDVRHFEAWEFNGDAQKMNLSFMARLDLLREVSESSIHINAAFAKGGHSHDRSFHYLGMAADIVIKKLTLQEMFQLAAFCGFRGIGVYPFWNTPGIHVDTRPWEHIATWMRNQKGTYIAVPEKYKELLIAA